MAGGVLLSQVRTGGGPDSTTGPGYRDDGADEALLRRGLDPVQTSVGSVTPKARQLRQRWRAIRAGGSEVDGADGFLERTPCSPWAPVPIPLRRKQGSP
jgi:hypothetical protein